MELFAKIAAGALLTSAGLWILVYVMNNVLPWEKMGDFCEEFCAKISRLGNMKYGKKVYEPIETFLQKKVRYLLERCFKGLDRDDKHG